MWNNAWKNIQRKRILIIDDEESFTYLTKKNLEETGRYKVRKESKGSRGLAAAKEFKPDLIFLDILMPDMDGGSVCFQLENDGDTKNIPVVFLTAAATKDEADSMGGIIGGHPFIAKPVGIDELVTCIEKHITK